VGDCGVRAVRFYRPGEILAASSGISASTMFPASDLRLSYRAAAFLAYATSTISIWQQWFMCDINLHILDLRYGNLSKNQFLMQSVHKECRTCSCINILCIEQLQPLA
jgi:hypothetical protein